MNYIVVSEDAKSIRELVAAAKAQNAESITAVVLDAADIDDAVTAGAQQVVAVEFAEGALKEAAADAIAQIAGENPRSCVLLTNTRRMVNLAGRLAYKLKTSPIIDATSLEGGKAKTVVFGGKAIQTKQVNSDYAVIALRPGAFDASCEDAPAAPVRTIRIEADDKAKVRGVRPKQTSGVNLSEAKAVVCVGRGVATREGFDACVALKDAIGGQMACTRPITETADPFMPRDTYLGASGVVIKPELYIGIATSGQQQHTMGMYESGTVVVINSDKNVPFFQAADYCLVGDYREIVPAITAALNA